MEKYIRLLNPKATNFDSIGGGSFGALTTQDVCLAISYAGLTTLQHDLFRLCNLSNNGIEIIKSLSKSIHRDFVGRNIALDKESHQQCIFVALVELARCPADYKPSVRSRAVIAGVSKDRIHRDMNDNISKFKGLLESDLTLACNKINAQFPK